MSHHGDKPFLTVIPGIKEIDPADTPLGEELKKLEAKVPEVVGGPTGQFPRGKLRPDDRGGILIKMGLDPQSKTVILDFGIPTAWVGFTADDARDIAKTLINLANGLDML